MIGQLINAAAGIWSNKIQAKVAKENTDKTNAANRSLAEYEYGQNRAMQEYEYNKNLEMWNKQNEYNLPGSQMERLKAAGLNPNLVYGSGAGQVTAAPAPKFEGAKYNAPTQSFNYKPAFDPLAVIGAFQDFQIKANTIDNMKAQREGVELDNVVKAANAQWASNNAMWKANKTRQEGVNLAQKYRLNKFQEEMAPFQLEMMKEGTNKRLRVLEADAKLKERQVEYGLMTQFGSLGINALNMLQKWMPRNMQEHIRRVPGQSTKTTSWRIGRGK